MIDQKELMVGNWLRDYFGVFRQVAYVGETVGLQNDIGGTDKYQNKPIFSNDLKDLHGISLTDEILEQCGAILNGNHFMLRTEVFYFYFFTMFAASQKTPQWQYDNCCIENVNDDKQELFWIPKPESLHQLQNLYFALTGSKLTVKLIPSTVH